MANFNSTLQQIVGYTSLLGLLNRSTGGQTPGAGQQEYSQFSDSVRANVRKFGIQKTSMAHVVISKLPKIFGSQAKISGAEKIRALATYRADSFTQPGVALATTEIHRYGVGPVEKKPYLPIFQDQTFSFINDSDGLIHKFFYLWMNGVIGFDELPRGNSTEDIFGKHPYEVEYKDNYTSIIDIYTYNESQNKVGVLKLFNAYPIFLGDVQRGWSDSNQLVRFPVTFTYSHWAYEDIPSSLQPTDAGRKARSTNMALMTGIAQTVSVLQMVASTKKPQNINDVINIVNNGSTVLRSLFPPSVEPTSTDYYTKVRGNGV